MLHRVQESWRPWQSHVRSIKVDVDQPKSYYHWIILAHRDHLLYQPQHPSCEPSPVNSRFQHHLSAVGYQCFAELYLKTTKDLVESLSTPFVTAAMTLM